MQLINNFFNNLFVSSFIPKTIIKPSEKDEIIASKTKSFENKTYLEKKNDYLNRNLSKDKEVIRYEFNNKNIKHNDDEKLIYVNRYKGPFNNLPQTGVLNKNKYKLSFSKDIRYKLINKLTKDDELIVNNGTYNPLDFPIPEGYYRLDADPCKARTAITRENKSLTNDYWIQFCYSYYIYFNRIIFDKNAGVWSEPTEKQALYKTKTFWGAEDNVMDTKEQNEVKDPQYWGD